MATDRWPFALVLTTNDKPHEKRAPEGARQFPTQTKSELEGVTQAQLDA
jgi:hypothetical protein